MPPLPPPNGMSATAHFHVIHDASAETSSSETSGWKRMPPFAGPRAMLCCTRKPSNMWIVPSSIITGSHWIVARRGFFSMSFTPASSLSRVAASSNCRSAFSSGFNWLLTATAMGPPRAVGTRVGTGTGLASRRGGNACRRGGGHYRHAREPRTRRGLTIELAELLHAPVQHGRGAVARAGGTHGLQRGARECLVFPAVDPPAQRIGLEAAGLQLRRNRRGIATREEEQRVARHLDRVARVDADLEIHRGADLLVPVPVLARTRVGERDQVLVEEKRDLLGRRLLRGA